MKFIYSILFVFAFTAVGLSQRTATVAPTSDFKTVQSGLIVSDFSFNVALTEQEATEIVRWSEANGPSMVITITADRKQLKYKLSPEINEQVLYAKLFHQLNVEDVVLNINGSSTVLSKEAFFQQVGL